MKKHANKPFIVTGNRLLDGAVVYMITFDDGIQWTKNISTARLFHSEDQEAALSLARPSVDNNEVVDVYTLNVSADGCPLGTRERIRAAGGPTIPFGTDASSSPVENTC